MSALADRLTRLRVQAGAIPASRCGPAPRSVPNAEPVVSMPSGRSANQATPTVDQLRALIASRARGAKTSPTPTAPARTPPDRSLPGEAIAPGLRYIERHVDCEQPPPRFTPDIRRPFAVHAEQLLCFDTETTGLAGGAGTRAFMIGAADWCDGRLRLRQLYLDAMAGEPAMLATFASWLSGDHVLVSYNGRSYDAPLLKTRYRLARLPDPIGDRGHIDLLHAVRRRWRGCWPNCRLATVERELLQVLREDDLPGAEAPSAWLAYLRGGSADKLRRVLAHNAQDIVSLARLLCRMHDGQPEPDAAGDRP